MQKFLDVVKKPFTKMDKGRSIKLALLLFVFVTLPVIIGTMQKQHELHQEAHAQANGVVPTVGTLWVYGIQANPIDDLAQGWTAQVWFGGPNDINRANKTPTYTGTNSLSWQDTAPNDEMDLYTSTPIDLTQYQYLTFFATASQPQQLFQVYLLNGYKQRIGTPLPMAQYGGVPIVGTWTVYDFPLASFNAGTTKISGIGINDAVGGPQPPIYFDDIAFSANKGENIGAGPGQAVNLPTLPQATPTPPFYPDISPWVYIIPGIIVFLAIFFE